MSFHVSKNTLTFILGLAFSATFCFAPATLSAQFGRVEMNMHGGGTSISVSNVNGVKTTKVNDQGKKYEIIESEEEGIKVKFTKVYGPKDAEKLKEDYPDLFMHLSSFPTETEGATVELNIQIVREVQAQNSEELEKNHPDAFAIYKKYNHQGGRIRFGGGIRGFGGEAIPIEIDGIKIPRIEIDRIEIPRIEIERPRRVEPKELDDIDI